MVSDYTREVLKQKMLQSDNLIYVCSENSRSSEWVKFELDYYANYGRGEIYIIKLDDKDNEIYKNLMYDIANNTIIGYPKKNSNVGG